MYDTTKLITPHLKFIYQDNELSSLEYSISGFDEEGNIPADISNPIFEWNPFEDMIFSDINEGIEALMAFADAIHATSQENRYNKDSYQRTHDKYKFINGIFDFSAKIICDGIHGCFIDITRMDMDIPGTLPHKKGVLINGNTDKYYSSFGNSSIIRVSENGSWKFIDNFQQMEFSSYENAAKVISFLIGRSTSKLANDKYIFPGYDGRIINVNESTNLFTGAFDNLSRYTPYTITGMYLMRIDTTYRVFPICESRYPIANTVIPNNHIVMDPVTKIVLDSFHNIYRIRKIYPDGTIYGTEISNQMYSEEISLTMYPYSSLDNFRNVVDQFLGDGYTVIESAYNNDGKETHRIWTISNYEKKTTWNYMLIAKKISYNNDFVTVYYPKFIDTRNNALIID